MPSQKSLIVKSHISEIKKICEQRGINYEIYPAQKPAQSASKISQSTLKTAYQKLAASKNYEREMKAWDAIEEDE